MSVTGAEVTAVEPNAITDEAAPADSAVHSCFRQAAQVGKQPTTRISLRQAIPVGETRNYGIVIAFSFALFPPHFHVESGDIIRNHFILPKQDY